MKEKELYSLRYPIGNFEKPDRITQDHLKDWISTLENFPQNVENKIKGLSETELNYKYRPNGWTIKQVVHHCADSHINSIMRFKLALTEDTPTIRPYFEDRFAKLIDYSQSLEASISILKGVHYKLGVLLKNLSDEDLMREFIHPEHSKHFSIEETIGIYAWHSNHHFAHIEQALEHKGMF